MRRRFSVVVAIVLLVVSGLFVFAANPVVAPSQTWTSDTDFSGGTFLSTRVVGTGNGASVQLSVNPTQNWINMAPSGAPLPRRGPAMTFDAVHNVILVFGGLLTSGYSNELWTYDTVSNTWTNITPGTSPPARWKAGFSYDPLQQVAVLYGGSDAAGARLDLWEFDVNAGTWAAISPAPPLPRPLASTPLVYDTVVSRHILVGEDPIGPTMTTWAYDAGANAWQDKAPATLPDPRSGHALSFDQGIGETILFGGAEALTVYGDWWSYNATTNTWVKDGDWTPNVTPNPRIDHAMIFGPNHAVNLMFGGVDSSSAYQPETWYYISTGNLWIQPPVGTAPGARKDHGFGWDSVTDRVIMFGGLLSGGTTYTNQTWAWRTGYYTSGNYESPTFDAGCANVNWNDVWWNATTPATTTARFKLASSSSPTGPFNFVGPDGLPGTFYSTTGTAVYSGHDNQRYFRWKLYETTGDAKVTPEMNDFTTNYVCPVAAPFIVSTSPADGATGVSVTAPIVVTFSEAMNQGTVLYTFSDAGVTFTTSWNGPSTVLTLTHTTPFTECAVQTMQITAGKDANDNLDLVAGPAPNPWSFTTECVNPYIVSTVPADGATNVALAADVVVTFSEAMTTTSVTWTITGGITLSGAWNPGEDVLTLSHGTPFAQCTVYTAEITAGTDKVALPLVAGPAPNPWSFTTVCPNPYIVSTVPADGAIGVALNSDIVVTFSKPMNTATVTWTINPAIPHTYTWQPGDQVLVINHTQLFTELTLYTVDITGGTDTGGLPLVAGPAPNPWTFTTAGVNPYIVSTVPADGATNVALAADVVVTFSEAMTTTSVTWTITGGITLSGAWNPGEDVLTLSHGTPFAQCTVYTAEITAGTDKVALPLVAGPVPNPWSFTTTCPLTSPANLRVSVVGADVQLAWDAVIGASSYNVYSAGNRFATFPSGWSLRGAPAGTTFLATTDGTDGQTHYYVVRGAAGATEGPNSTMGVKVELAFGHSATNTNIAWFSLPYTSGYTRASDIANALGPTNIDVVGKWDPARQSSQIYYYSRGRWRGTDFTVNAGDGLYLGTRQAFSWTIAGTDRSVARAFIRNGGTMGNVNWISLPYTGVYQRASDIATELGSTQITEVGLWNAATQSVTRYYWTGSTWAGTDFTFAPGAGIYVIVASSFTWTPILITPAVP